MTLQTNLAIGKKIVFYIKHVLGMKRTNAHDDTIYRPHPIHGVLDDEWRYPTSDKNLAAAYTRVRTQSQMSSRAYTNQIMQTGQQLPINIRAMFCQYINVTVLSIVSELAGIRPALAEQPYPRGACSEFVGIIAALLMAEAIPFEIFAAKLIANPENINHAFVVLGRASNSDERNINTWGPAAVIIDAWDCFKCIAVQEAIAAPQIHPFFEYRHKDQWHWTIDYSFPSQILADIPDIIKQLCYQELIAIRQRFIPTTLMLPRDTQDPLLLLNLCGKSKDEIPQHFFCSHSKQLMRTPVKAANNKYYEKSVAALLFTEENLTVDAALYQEILRYLYHTAISAYQYDFYRFNFPLTQYPNINIHYLKHLSGIISLGITRDIIEVTAENISINRLWFEHQISPEARADIIKQAKLPRLC